MLHDYPRALGTVIVKIVLVIITVFFIILIFAVQLILWLVSVLMDWILGPEVVSEDAAPRSSEQPR